MQAMVDHTPLSNEAGAATVNSVPHPTAEQLQKKKEQEMMLDEDPLLISQTLTYVTDDGSVLHSFQSAPFSLGFKIRFFILELIFILLLVAAVPIGAHGTVVAVSIVNMLVLAWFWYNLVRSVDVTDDGSLRFWIGNIEIEVPFDKIVSLRRVASSNLCSSMVSLAFPYRGFQSDPYDGVCIVTTVPSTPFWLWPRSAGKPDRSCCFGLLPFPRLTVVFSPSSGSLNFIRDVENEMRNFSNGKMSRDRSKPKTTAPSAVNPDFLDV